MINVDPRLSFGQASANASRWEDLPRFCQSFVNTMAAYRANGGTQWFMPYKRGLEGDSLLDRLDFLSSYATTYYQGFACNVATL